MQVVDKPQDVNETHKEFNLFALNLFTFSIKTADRRSGESLLWNQFTEIINFLNPDPPQ
jgi:hypothetical protein